MSAPPPSHDSSPAEGRSSLPRHGPWIALASVLVIGAMPFLVCPRLQSSRAEARAARAMGLLRRCLGEPLTLATLRGRSITAERRGVDWPARCAPPAAELEVALTALTGVTSSACDGVCCDDDRRCQTLTESRRALGLLRKAVATGHFEDGEALRLFALGASAGIHEEPVPDRGPLPPEPTRPRLATEHPPLAAGGYDVSALVAADGGGWRLLLHARDRHAVICAVRPTAATADCEPLPSAIPIGDTVLLVDGSPRAPLHVVARRGRETAPERWGVYEAATGRLALALEHEVLGVTLSPAGEVAALVHDGAGYFLLSPQGPPVALEAGPLEGRPLGPPLLFGARLLWARAGAGSADLVSQELTWREGRPTPSAPRRLATARGWQPGGVAMEACRSGRLRAFVVTADPPEPDPEALVVITDGRHERSHRVDLASPWVGLACHEEGATLTAIEEREAVDLAGRSVEGRYVVAHAACTIAGCQSARSTTRLGRRRRASRFLAGSLGGQTVLLWRSGLGDVRLAVAAPSALGATSPQTAFEGDEHGGYGWDRHGAELLTRDGFGLILVASEQAGDIATRGFIVDREGGLRPLRVAR